MSNPKPNWNPIFASVPLVLTFANETAATGYECQNPDTTPPATWPNNDADADGSQGLNLEKVKNLYRTATTKKVMPAAKRRKGHSRSRD
jgi:hypothetical protein